MTYSPLVTQMLCAEFYPHPVTEPIELVQTHISFVFLTGTYAYKVKKAVNFGFLDFSELENRKRFCEEEVRLNRRLAPELYLDVVPIVQEGDKFFFQKDAPQALEYAVKMMQFPQENLLIHLFEKQLLTLEQVQTIGKQLAAFHQRALTSDYINTFGTVSAVRETAENNYDHTRAYIGRVQTQEQFDQTRSYSERYFHEHSDRFVQRMQGGKIRECHGDLHLRNICIWQDKIQIFDCIEFNEPFRNCDVLYDAAFLFMDLEFRGRPDLANGFLNSYLEETGDYEGVTLLPLYSSMRAYIRAKVASFLLDDPHVGEAAKGGFAEEARAYYQLAQQYTLPRQGKLILMCGLSGSGKSTLATELARDLRAIHIRSDAVRKHLGGIALRDRGDASLYTPEMTSKTYAQLCYLGILLAKEGFTVILDAKYDRIAHRWDIREKAEAADIPLHILHCQAAWDTLYNRVQKRAEANTDIADATPDLLASQQSQFEEFSPEEIPLVIPVATDQQPDKTYLLSLLQKV